MAQQHVSRCVSAELCLIDQYDTWHGVCMYLYLLSTCTCTCVHINHTSRVCTCIQAHNKYMGVLCCFALFVCLTLLASFFLPSHLSLKHEQVHTMLSFIQVDNAKLSRHIAGDLLPLIKLK